MRLSRRAPLGAVLLALLLGACGGDGEAPTPQRSASTVAAATVEHLSPSVAATSAATANAASPSATGTPTIAPTAAPTQAATLAATAPPAPASAAITVRARDIAFDRSEIHVKTGVRLTVTLDNQDAGIEHNLSFDLPGVGHPGCTGPCSASQTFTPAAPGRHLFFCTIHAPMFGDFIIDP